MDQNRMEYQRPDPPIFSWLAFFFGAVINGLGCIALGGLRFLDGMGEFGASHHAKPTLATILCWIWSPLAMLVDTLAGYKFPQTGYGPHISLSVCFFGIMAGLFVPWVKRPLYP